jgi:hypothetical protein
VKSDIERLLEEVYRPEGREIWLKSPNPLLGGAVPNDLIAAGEGDRVAAVLHGLAEGVVL